MKNEREFIDNEHINPNTMGTRLDNKTIKPIYPSTEGKTAQQIAKERIEQARSKVKPNEFY